MANAMSNQLNAGYDKLLNATRIAADVMKENGIDTSANAANPSLTNIIANINQLQGKIIALAENATARDIPTNTSYLRGTAHTPGVGLGCGSAYLPYLLPLWEGSGNPPGTQKAFIAPVGGAYVQCKNYMVRTREVGGKVAISYYPVGESEATARTVVSNGAWDSTKKIVPNPHWIILVDSTGWQMFNGIAELHTLNWGGYQHPEGMTNCSYFIDAFGQVFVAGVKPDGQWALASLNDQSSAPTIPMYALKKKIPIITGFEVFEDATTKCVYFRPTGTGGYALQYRLPTDAVNTPIVEVPQIAQGTIRVNNTLVKVDNLGFAPDFVFITFRGEAEVNIGLGNMILSRQQLLKYNNQPSLALSDKKFIYETVPTMRSTVAGDVNSTLNSGYVNQDGFVMNMEFDYITAFADWVAIGRKCGVDPYLDTV